MKRKFILELAGILTLTTLLFAGCSSGGNTANKLMEGDKTNQTSNASAVKSTSAINKDPKKITDSDLLNSDSKDSTVQLDPVDGESQQLSSDEIDTLLNENNDLNDIPSNFNVK